MQVEMNVTLGIIKENGGEPGLFAAALLTLRAVFASRRRSFARKRAQVEPPGFSLWQITMHSLRIELDFDFGDIKENGGEPDLPSPI